MQIHVVKQHGLLVGRSLWGEAPEHNSARIPRFWYFSHFFENGFYVVRFFGTVGPKFRDRMWFGATSIAIVLEKMFIFKQTWSQHRCKTKVVWRFCISFLNSWVSNQWQWYHVTVHFWLRFPWVSPWSPQVLDLDPAETDLENFEPEKRPGFEAMAMIWWNLMMIYIVNGHGSGLFWIDLGWFKRILSLGWMTCVWSWPHGVTSLEWWDLIYGNQLKLVAQQC